MKNKTDLELSKKLRIGIFDIETTDLDGFWGETICVVIKQLNKRIYDVIRVDHFRNEQNMLKQVVKVLNSYDVLVGWNTSGFDFPFLNTRCLIFKIEPPERNYRRDLLYVARGNMRLPSFKLKYFTKNIIGRTQKTETTPKIKQAIIGKKKWAIDFVVDHCIKDVDDTEKDYKALMPLLGKLKRKN